MKRYTYGVTSQGKKLGEAHHNAKLSDKDVERIRDLYEEGMVSYAWLAKKFGVTKATIADICTYRKRATTPDRYKSAKMTDLKRTPPVSKYADDDDRLLDYDYIPETVTLEDALGISSDHAHRLIEDLD